MVYTNEVQEYANSKFCDMLEICGGKKEDILYKISLCNEEERFLIKYLYASMNVHDIFSYDFELFYEYVKHAIFLRETCTWTYKIPEDIFLNYVVHYRINNEEIEDCRKTFYDMLNYKLTNKSMEEAILEVNYWCAEKVTYKSTDERTASPLTLLKCGYGRCGEESTFTVTALRSVGIPARQIYTPRWAHCDDNHAWVEVWCDGEWHYLGACEPEKVLDKGWFTSAASRAMIIHSRIFSGYFKDEDVISNNKVVTTINNIRSYASSKKITVKVLNFRNKPVKDAKVRFQILNYSEFANIAILNTDESGKVCINIGLGTVVIHVVKDKKFMYKVVNTKDLDEITFNINEFVYSEEEMDTIKTNKEILNKTNENINEEYINLENRNKISNGQDIDIISPSDKKAVYAPITKDEELQHKERVTKCNTIREEKDTKTTKDILKSIDNLDEYESKIKEILLDSMENYNEILEFLRCSYNNHKFEEAISLLSCLKKKDYIDSKANILTGHINNAVEFTGDYPKEIYFNYVLCPRIYLESITNYREFIIKYFNNDLKESFVKKPIEIWSYVKQSIKELKEYEYEELYTTPVALLNAGIGSLMSKKILFVAICRSIGIPARINEIDLYIEYYDNGFIKVEDKDKLITSEVIINNVSQSELKYFQNLSIAALKNGVYKTLNLDQNIKGNGNINISLNLGDYRILTSNRLPNGGVFVKKYTFNLRAEETKVIDINLRDIKISDMMENYEIDDLSIKDKNDNIVNLHQLVKDKKCIIIWIEEGMEPTEHILNEMINNYKDFNDIKANIIFILKDIKALKNKTLEKVYELIPNIKTCFDHSKENINNIARRMYLDPDKLPLILIAEGLKTVQHSKEYINGIYATSGYNVGTAELIIKIIQGN
ncbi:transglutaminase domain-containing protein [Clostridium algidicarnis]|uniref:transglutaminase domain-containing protein n=1 Tax=Clostridium algidicarnis TaxID=37659 RepID=UPI0004967B5E|nr:transglutaminase domain-containing protein [Clostridium algidicarnis]